MDQYNKLNNWLYFKERTLLLEIESSISNISIINLIVMGLSFNIQDKLDKEDKRGQDEI